MSSESENLITRLFSGDLPAAEAHRLSQMLAGDAELRALYRQHAEINALLLWRCGNVNSQGHNDIDAMSIAGLLQEVEEEAAHRRMLEEAAERARQRAAAAERRRIEKLQWRQRNVRRPRAIVIPYSVACLGAAALAASLLWIAFTVFPSGDARVASNPPIIDETPQAPPVATVVDAIEAELTAITENATDRQTAPVSTTAGTTLVPGQYALVKGVVKLEFNRGVSAILEAPATVELKSADRLRVVQGRLVGHVPPQAIGFAVEAPTATIVDLGTEFGIAVPDGEEVDITVFDGEVEVLAAARGDVAQGQPAIPRQRLRENASVRVDVQGSFVAAETKPELYFRAVPPSRELEQKRAYERWLAYSEQLAADPDVVAFYTFDDQKPDDTLLLNRAADGRSLDGEIRGAQWAEGRWPLKQALRFADANSPEQMFKYVKLDIPGRFDELTLAAWLNLEVLVEGYNGILMTETWDQPGQVHWQILRDGRLHAGVAERSDGTSGGTYDSQGFIKSGVWKHVAVVFDRQQSQISFFIDGRNVGSVAASLADSLLLGPLNLGDWKRDEEHAKKGAWQALHGRMDELLVLGRAMNEQEIRALYEAGKPSDR